MKKNKAQKEWQQRNADKVRAYTTKYLEDKVQTTVTLTKEIAEKIDKLKPPSQTYGGWIREQIEEIVRSYGSGVTPLVPVREAPRVQTSDKNSTTP